MKFLCDVHISFKLVNAIKKLGFDCVHINSILDKWFTKDDAISKYADDNEYILISKDSDFRNNFYIKKSPKKLIKINLGNISNEILISIFSTNLEKINFINKEYQNFIIEIDNENITYSGF